MKKRLWKLPSKQKDNYIKFITLTYSLSTGASNLARALVDYPMNSCVKNDPLIAKLGVKRGAFYRYLKELREKKLIDYQRKPKKDRQKEK